MTEEEFLQSLPPVTTVRGKPIEDLSRDELIETLQTTGGLLLKLLELLRPQMDVYEAFFGDGWKVRMP